MATEPQEHDFIAQVCAEDAARRVPPRLSEDPAVRLAECRGGNACMGKNCTAYAGKGSPEHSDDCLKEAAKSQGWETFNEEGERDRFEFFAKGRTWFCPTMKDRDDTKSEYADKFTDAIWMGWLACAKSRAEGK